MKLSLASFLFFLSYNAFSQTAYLPMATSLKKGGTQLSLTTEYFNTSAVVNVDGEQSILEADSSYEKIDIILDIKYGLTNQLEGGLGIKQRYAQADFRADFGKGDDTFSLSKTGGDSTYLAFKYSFKEIERLKYAVQGKYSFPLQSNQIYTGGAPDDLVISDDERSYSVGLDFYYKTKSLNILEGQLLYRSPGTNLSTEVFSKLQVGLVWNYVSLYAGGEVVSSLNRDPYTSDPDQKPVVFQGPSAQVNSINRQWSAPFVGLNLALGKSWRLRFEYGQVISGRSTDLGSRALVNLGWRSEKDDGGFTKKDSTFKQYRIEGLVRKLAKSRRVAIVDQGVGAGMREGMGVDFYYFDYVGGNTLIARGVVIKAKSSKSLVKIVKKFSRKRVEEGTVMRADLIAADI